MKVFNEERRLYQIEGRPDLDTGLEIKNVSTAKSENSISAHISVLKRKRGLKQVVIDISENDALTDDDARQMIRSSLRRHRRSSALMINHGGEIELIKR